MTQLRGKKNPPTFLQCTLKVKTSLRIASTPGPRHMAFISTERCRDSLAAGWQDTKCTWSGGAHVHLHQNYHFSQLRDKAELPPKLQISAFWWFPSILSLFTTLWSSDRKKSFECTSSHHDFLNEFMHSESDNTSPLCNKSKSIWMLYWSAS